MGALTISGASPTSIPALSGADTPYLHAIVRETPKCCY
jgi:hypothetical protein